MSNTTEEDRFYLARAALAALQRGEADLVIQFNEQVDPGSGRRDWDSLMISNPDRKERLEQIVTDELARRKEAARKAIKARARDLDKSADDL